VVTGTPGTGKTTFSKALAKSIGAGYLNLTQYVSQNKLYARIDPTRHTKVVNVARTRNSLRKALAGKRGSLVVDSHIPEGIVPRQLVRRVFVLRCHPKVLESRLRAKNWKPNKIRENVLSEILDSCLTSAVRYYGWRKVVQLNTSSGSMRRFIASAQRSLRGKLKRRARFDWLKELDKQGLLDRYLR